MDILFLLRLLTGILFITGIVPSISLVNIFYEESKRIGDGLKFINFILFCSAVLGSISLIFSLIITFSLLSHYPVSAVHYNLRNLLVAIFFNVPTWGLVYVRRQTKKPKK